MESGKRIEMIYNGKAVTILNQRSRLWTHPYDYRTPQKATLSSAGCGVFSICHCGQWLTGKAFSPEELADFSMQNGGPRRRRYGPSCAPVRHDAKGPGRAVWLQLSGRWAAQ